MDNKIQKNKMVQARKDIYAALSANELSTAESEELLRHILIERRHKTQEAQLKENWERIKELPAAEDEDSSESTPEEPAEDGA